MIPSSYIVFLTWKIHIFQRRVSGNHFLPFLQICPTHYLDIPTDFLITPLCINDNIRWGVLPTEHPSGSFNYF